MPAPQPVEVLLRQLTISTSLLSFPPTVVLPGVAFPAVGPVDLGSPPFQLVGCAHQPSARCCTTTASRPSHTTSLVAGDVIPGLLPVFVFRLRLANGWKPHVNARALVHPVPPRLPGNSGQENAGSPTFPSDRLDDMPRSQTPVVSWALAIACSGLQPSGACKPSAFSALLLRVSSRTTTLPISGTYHAAYHLAPPGSAPPWLA